jgi:hypothetical protein
MAKHGLNALKRSEMRAVAAGDVAFSFRHIAFQIDLCQKYNLGISSSFDA